MAENREELNETFREQAIQSLKDIGLEDDEAERVVEDYMDTDFY